MKCPRCEFENREGVRFCEGCGAKLEQPCPACGTAVPLDRRFCGTCGHVLTGAAPPAAKFASPHVYTPKHLAERILTSRSALEGERKQVTVLFADLKGSMELLADRDPEEARRLLDPVLEHMMEAVHRYEGTVNQVMGDGIMALFGAPIAHEDHAVRACYAALAMQSAIERYTEGVRRAHGIEVKVRIGLNSGEVVVRAIGSDLHMDYTAVGQTTHLAARMEQLATPGSVRLTGETLRLAEGFVQVKSLGPVPVKGLPDPVEVFELVGAGLTRTRLQAAAARGLTRFVGRDAELDQLRQALEKARTGHGQVVALVGEPGVGKSRLFREFIHSHRTHGWLVLESSSVSYGKATPYLPVIDLLKAYFQIEARDDGRKIKEKVTGKLLTLDRALEPTLAAFLALLDVAVEDSQWQALEPSQRRQRTLEAVKRLLLRENQVQPLCLVFEDLHWIDSETQALLDNLVESLPTARLLCLVDYRPEYQHRWGQKTYYSQLRIDPLPPESAHELLRSLMGEDPGLQPLKQLLIERTDGNPFFLEESVRTLVETKALVGEHGAYQLVKALPSIQVPATVHAVLAARIDRVPPDEKRLLQSAAVIGEDVPFALLLAIADEPEGALRQGLAHLQAAEFLYEASLFPDLEYTFKHGLTYQVAYGSLLQERRRALHARIVEALEGLYPDRLAEQVDRLAHHAFRGDVWPKAVTYLRQAGEKAVARSANREAIGCLEQALAALEHLPESRETLAEALDIRIALGPALIAIKGGGAPEVEASYVHARELCGRLDDASRLFSALWGLWYVNYARGQYRVSREIGEGLLRVAQDGQDSALLVEAHHAMWATLAGMGDAASAQTHLQHGLSLYDRQQHRSLAFLYGAHDPGACCRNFRAMTRWEMGYPDEALTSTLEALSLARELSHPLTTVIALYFATWVRYHRGENQTAGEKAETLMGLAGPQEFSIWADDASIFLARLMMEQGGGEDHLARVHGRLTPTRAAGATWRDLLCLCLLAEAYGRIGHPDKGLQMLLAIPSENTEGFYAAELHRIMGELLLSQAAGEAPEAERHFRRSMEIARARQETSFELRAAMSLSGLLRRQAKREEARGLLSEVYGRFTEGFDTRDLREAKALLEALS